MARFDPEPLFRSITVPGDGYTYTRIAVGPVQHTSPIQGVKAPDGTCWEIRYHLDGLSQKDRAFAGESIQPDIKAGFYQYRITTLPDGRTLLLERREHYPVPWQGLEVLGPWDDRSCGGCPLQYEAHAQWIHPDGSTEPVSLYLHWRFGDPWTGNVIRCDNRNGFAFLTAPWSPNLLPTCMEPLPERPSGLTALFVLRGDTRPRGHTRDDLAGAQEALIKAATEWLLGEEAESPEAWKGP